MAKNISDLAAEAIIIQGETDAGDNTASRVGTMFLDIIDYLGTLNTSSDSEDEGGSGGGGGGGVSLNEPLSSINNMASTPGSGNKVLVCQNGIWAYGDYGGGSTPTSGVTWNALAGNTSEQINLTHLTTALNSCSFWGRHPVNGVVSGDMIDVGSITMNGKNHTFLIDVDDDGNLRFNGNIYATGGVSALGNSSSGGGGGGGSTVIWKQLVDSEHGTHIANITIDGTLQKVYAPTSGGAGGATALEELSDVSLVGSPSNGEYLKHDGNTWVNASFGPVITDLNAIPESSYTGLYILSATNGRWSLTEAPSSGISRVNVSETGGNAVTSASVSGNTLTLTKGTTFLTSIPVASANTLGGIKVGSHLTISNGVLSVNGTNLNVASAATATSATEAGKLSGNTTYSAWGQKYWQGGKPKDINGNMNGVNDIYMNFSDNSTSSHAIKMKCFQSITEIETVLLDNSDTLSFGYGARTNGLSTEIQGKNIVFAVNKSTPRVEAGEFTSTGLFHVKQGTQGIRIGDGVIKWNSSNNSLYVERAADAGGGVANFYASGGVSALGFSSTNGRNARVSYLVADSISVSGDITDQADAWHIGRDEFYHEGAVEASEVNASRFYISPNNFTPSSGNTNCILYAKKVNGVNKLYFYNGSSEIQIA